MNDRLLIVGGGTATVRQLPPEEQTLCGAVPGRQLFSGRSHPDDHLTIAEVELFDLRGRPRGKAKLCGRKLVAWGKRNLILSKRAVPKRHPAVKTRSSRRGW